MNIEIMSTGEQLKTKRQAGGIKLAEVSEKLKIMEKYLEALERDDYSNFPSETHIKLFLKAYASYLRLDASSIMKEYNNLKQPHLDEADVKQPSIARRVSAKSRQKNALFLFTALALCVVVIGVVFLLMSGPKEEEQEVPQFKPPVDSIKTTLKVKAKDASWIEVSADGVREPGQIIHPGVEKEFKGEKLFKLWIGNAGGIDLFVNDKQVLFDGKQGEVIKYLMINPDGSFQRTNEESTLTAENKNEPR